MSKPQQEKPATGSTPPPKKGTVLDQIKSRRSAQYAGSKPPVVGGATPPTGHKPAPEPKVITPPPQPQQPPVPPAQPTQPTADEGNILELVLNRAMQNLRETKAADDKGVQIFQALSHQIQTGSPLKDIEDLVIPHLGEMGSKLHLANSTITFHNVFERGPLYLMARWSLEKSLWDDLLAQRLTPPEKLALLSLAIKELDKIQDKANEQQKTLEKSGKGGAADIETAVEKPDRVLHKVEDPSAKALAGTSAVGRELGRRLVQQAGQAGEKLVTEALKTSQPST